MPTTKKTTTKSTKAPKLSVETSASLASPFKAGDQVLIRDHGAGVFVGRLVAHQGKEAIMADARRLWYWSGASSVSEIALKGVSRPTQCKFPAAVPQVYLTSVVEVLPMSAEATASIAAVPVWTQF